MKHPFQGVRVIILQRATEVDSRFKRKTNSSDHLKKPLARQQFFYTSNVLLPAHRDEWESRRRAKETLFWTSATNLVLPIGKRYPSGLVWDCVGGTTAAAPKWVSDSCSWDSSITGMSYSNLSASVRRRQWQRWILGPKWLSSFSLRGPFATPTCRARRLQLP